MLFGKDTVVFIEDPTYFAAARMLSQDLQMNVTSVPCDEDGMDCEELDRLLTAKRPAQSASSSNPLRPFWALVYTITVYNNPTGRCYNPNRCRKLVELARKHDVMILAEDVYNLIHFGDGHPPPRLLSYDRRSDPDYKGHVVSSATFSKILAPGLRLGWVEAPERILTLLHGSNMAWSGGSLNHYASKLAGAILELGLQTQHLRLLRQIYKKRCDAVCEILRDNLPPGCKFEKPQGGFFIWIEFPEDVDTFKMVQFIAKEYKVSFFPGVSFYQEDVLCKAMKTFCAGAKAFISMSQTSG
nr:hypothetical protein BaRGS_020806 [Batillaria attramentaria]